MYSSKKNCGTGENAISAQHFSVANHRTRPLKIAIMTWRDLDHPEAGGAEVFAERTAEVMAKTGHNVTIVSADFDGAESQLNRNGFSIVRSGGRFSVYLHGMWHLLKNRKKYDVVLDVQNGVPFWAPWVFPKTVVLLVHHVHREQWHTFFPQPISSIGWFLESKLSPFVYRKKHYITVSESSRRELAQVGVDPERVSVIYSGNEAPPAVLEREPDLDRGFHLVALGRLVPHKHVEFAIDAVAELADRFPEIHLDVVGSGDWMSNLVAHAEARGVTDRVTLHGHVDNETKHRLLSRAAVMAMPSLKEGWGLTILEAGYHAVPSVAFRHAGGTQESIQDGHTGILCDTNDEFIEGIARLLASPEERAKMGAAARVFALRFDWERTGSELTELLEKQADQN